MDPTTTRVLLAIVVFFAALIGLVIVVGLIQGKVDPSGVAAMLGGVVTSIVGGMLLRGRSNEDKNGRHRSE